MLSEYFQRQRSAVLARVNGTAKAWRGKNLSAASDPFDLAEWNRRLAATALPVLTETVQQGGAQALDQLGLSISFDLRDPDAEAWLAAKQQTFARQINETSWQDLRASLTAGLSIGESIPDLMNRVRQTFTAYEDFRVERIARTEVVGASNAGSYLAATQTGQVETKTWLAALDHRTRASHVAAHGQTVAMDADFTVGGARGPVPHQLPSAKEVVNCRCTVIYNLKAERPISQLPMTPGTPPAAPTPPPAPPKPPRAPRKPKAPPVPPPFPSDLSLLEDVKALGGSTGARLVKDPATGATYVLKRGASPDHLKAEMAADGVYAAFGAAGIDVRVPEFRAYTDANGNPVKLARFHEGKSLADATPTQMRKAKTSMKNTFVLDALMGNWDVVGLAKDNVLIGNDGVLRRIDNGGSLDFRAMGARKTARQWSEGVEDLWSMRDPAINANVAEMVAGLKTKDVNAQVRAVVAAFDANRGAIIDALSLASNAQAVTAIFEARVESLRRLERVTTKLLDDGFTDEYAGNFGKAYQGLTAVGVRDRLPVSMAPRPNEDVRYIYDPNGDKFDSMRYDTIGGNNPRAGQGLKSAQGLLKDYMREQGTSYRTLESYGAAQGGDSWSRLSIAAKEVLFTSVRPVPFSDLFWKTPKSVQSLKSMASTALSNAGITRDDYLKALTINHAYTYMTLENVDLPRHDRETQTMTAWRTEEQSVMSLYRWAEGSTIVPKRGYLESFSGFQPIRVFGTEATLQTVPFHRVFGTYMESRDNPQNGLFLGDGENEWVIMPDGIPSKYVGTLSRIDWKAEVDAFEASKGTP